ncbi:uncharacterized protein MKK02DRAFT_42067 [Dioszegia hungarica]|uniref:Uncharacterized protein n=1 Tax=Dioszegia hungarica TaxID=4972 RepID=A0AA38HGG0_9TREE|nr:uncharacterized protein MKK02DRAFT_42067 [Dioszegia hungarica]KAI9639026.1 hypothetical protein MKK02DRAFT_42067 [Dioszegia hungarica]
MSHFHQQYSHPLPSFTDRGAVSTANHQGIVAIPREPRSGLAPPPDPWLLSDSEGDLPWIRTPWPGIFTPPYGAAQTSRSEAENTQTVKNAPLGTVPKTITSPAADVDVSDWHMDYESETDHADTVRGFNSSGSELLTESDGEDPNWNAADDSGREVVSARGRTRREDDYTLGHGAAEPGIGPDIKSKDESDTDDSPLTELYTPDANVEETCSVVDGGNGGASDVAMNGAPETGYSSPLSDIDDTDREFKYESESDMSTDSDHNHVNPIIEDTDDTRPGRSATTLPPGHGVGMSGSMVRRTAATAKEGSDLNAAGPTEAWKYRHGQSLAMLDVLMDRGIKRTTTVNSIKIPLIYLRELVGLMGTDTDPQRYQGYAIHMIRSSDRSRHYSLLPEASISKDFKPTRPLRQRGLNETLANTLDASLLLSGAPDRKQRWWSANGKATWSKLPGASSAKRAPTLSAAETQRRHYRKLFELCKTLDRRGVRCTSSTMFKGTKLGFLKNAMVKTEPKDSELEAGSATGFVIDDPAKAGAASQAVLLDWRRSKSHGRTYSLLTARWMRPFLKEDDGGADSA